jgi:hypothetical protein
MDLLFVYRQEKQDLRKTTNSICDLRLYGDEDNILFTSSFDFDYSRYGEDKHVTFIHKLNIQIKTGNIFLNYEIENSKNTNDSSKNTSKKNNFNILFDVTENGFYNGERRQKFWGVKYQKATNTIFNLIYKIIQPNFKNEYYREKNYTEKHQVNPLYDVLVDYHLDMNGIKPHDGVYYNIRHDYPKKKYLKTNNFKFLPSILDSYSIKSKYLLGVLNKNTDNTIHIKSLNYICKLFGENYIDYIKKVKWETVCYDLPPNKRIHQLKNDSEKRLMIQLINNWEKKNIKTESFIYSINKLLTLREFLEKKGLKLKFNAKNDNDFDNLLETWTSIQKHLKKGYKLRYNFPEDFVKTLESPIIHNNETYKPKILMSEDDFRIEGFLMKNCMSKQFSYGSLYVYISLLNKKKRINVQYRLGVLSQHYGKTNTETPKEFLPVIDTLSKRMVTYRNMIWKIEKYEIFKS